jgi:glutamate carboxypeptidase
VTVEVARAVWNRLESRQTEMADLLGDLVRIESPSGDREALDQMAGRLEELFGDFAPVERQPIGPQGARHLHLTLDDVAEPELPHVLILGHYDTVWARGTLDRLPFEVSDSGVITGPGCFDMKGGLVLLYYAVRELRAIGHVPRRPVRIVFNCDEEVRSRTSRDLIGKAAEGAVAAFVFEAPLPGGGLKTARKGTGTYRLVVEGRAAHAGIEPEKGASAVVELAHQVMALHALNDPIRGTTVNVGVVGGGTRPNVVPARAEAEIDVRVATSGEATRVGHALDNLRPAVAGTSLTVEADLSRPPMEPTSASRRLFAQARALAAGAGMPELTGGSTGGASDANLVAAMGIPTLDGFGPEGGGAHADDEHVLLASMPRRAALVAGLLASV